MKLINIPVSFFSMMLILASISCTKFIDKKSNQAFIIPATVADCQAIIDNDIAFNIYKNNGIGEVSSDNYYIDYAGWSSMSLESSKSLYIWDDELFYNNYPGDNDWSNLYSVVYSANIALESLENVPRTNQNQQAWDNVKGEALFYRGYAHQIVARNFAKAYDSVTAGTDYGIPLRLTSDFNEVSKRSTLQDSYDQILKDLLLSIPLLPNTQITKERPSKPAAFALLARIYLCLHDYTKAASYSDSSLKIVSTLMDYNNDPSISQSSTSPFTMFNPEVIFFSQGSIEPLYRSIAKVDTILYRSYDLNDKRKTLFFSRNSDGSFQFIGDYTGSQTNFNGIATDEVYLTRAEANAKLGNVSLAMQDLNTLLAKRFITGSFIALTASNAIDALNKIRLERRKELLMRDLRFMDIKRLNKESANINVTRSLNGKIYLLPPNDNKWALPLPATIIQLTVMPQNPR